MRQKLENTITKKEWLLPLFIFLFFLLASLPGIRWGAPALWNPDEMIWRVDMALQGHMQFDVTEPDFNYPSLPKYVMYAIGWVTYGLGKSSFALIVAARVFSAVLGALAGILVYYLARLIGADKRISLFAGLLYVVSGVAASNGRFAHNDLYLQFFTILSVYFVIKYRYTRLAKWLYASFFSVGLAASSKYTGGSLIILPVVIFVIVNWTEVRRRWLPMIGSLVLGGLVSFFGYGLGTPKALAEPVNYFSKVLPALQNLTLYGFNSGSPIGLFGQWTVFENAVGTFVYYLFIFTFLWYAVRLALWKFGKATMDPRQAQAVGIFILTLVIFDLPFMISINYIERYFIPFVPFLAVMSALLVDEVLRFASRRKLTFIPPAVATLVVIGLAYSVLRLVSISLLFMNDARIPATDYIAEIRGYQTSIEYTLYPPLIEKKRFERAHNYPIYFIEWEGDEVPTGGRFEYNQGEQGLLKRDTDYFVVDSYTYDRFYTDTICATTPVECDFFKRLLAGEVENFRLVQAFKYELPPCLPQVSLSAVNPEVRIYERVRK
ncbi:MAG: phospholipid carrier-dependent glycosyltransferase [Anaerolineales bacterium]|nr:phospholipid carrier-dependent glycosyltransferase [Anaerolineales bacterium]